MRIVIIAVVMLVLLGGGGAGAYLFFHHPAQAATGKEEIKKAEPKKDEKLSFVQLDPLILPVIDGHGVTQTISVVVSIECADDKAQDNVANKKPVLTDAYLQDLYGTLSKKDAMPDGTLQVGKLKARLNKITQGVMGDGVVKDVLIQVVQQHPV